MEKILTIIGAAFAAGLFILILPLIGATFGAFTGWVLSFVWNDEIIRTLTAFGIETEHVSLSNIGCALGFIGSFFRSSCSTTS